MDKKKRDMPEGLSIPACLFLGFGIGFLTNNLVAWIFIGLGTGFLIMLIALLIKAQRNKR